jgi:selenocysteine-specific elongation factor
MADLTKNVIVGTAGHIDHGKSSLVAALTGTHPDRLEEEKRRGITIDIGFAFLDEGSLRLGFVDVPGHERFVANMLAGAAGIDLVLLVIAAGESIKPQTREHFDICRLLGVKRGLVALTKADLVDSDTLGLTRLEVEEYLRGSFLESALILAVSAKTGTGLNELRAALRAAANNLPARNTIETFRLPIDRAFAMKGFGAVVTGTLISGSVAADDEVELLPGGKRLRVRGVQSAGKHVECAFAGQRTAINLAGIEHTALARGMTLVAPGKFTATRRIDARLELLPSFSKLRQRARVHFHSGTAQTIAEIVLYGETELLAGKCAFAQLRLQDEMLLLPGDRFIIRQFSPVITIGGGQVLDPAPRRAVSRTQMLAMSRDADRKAFLETLETGTHEEILAALTARALLGLRHREILARTAWADEDVRGAAERLVAAGRVKAISTEPLMLLSRGPFEDVRQRIVEKVKSFQRDNPLLPGIAREDLRATLGRRVMAETFRAALEELAREGALEVHDEFVKLPGVQIALRPDEARAKDRIEQAFASTGLAVPSVSEVLAQLAIESKRAENLLHLLLREKTLVRVSPDLIFHCESLARLKAQVAAYKKAGAARISVPVFKELAGITRKYAIPLLEYLDRERVTRRSGDDRVIL